MSDMCSAPAIAECSSPASIEWTTSISAPPVGRDLLLLCRDPVADGAAQIGRQDEGYEPRSKGYELADCPPEDAHQEAEGEECDEPYISFHCESARPPRTQVHWRSGPSSDRA